MKQLKKDIKGTYKMIPFLDLKGINTQYREELIGACIKAIDAGWYVQKNELVE